MLTTPVRRTPVNGLRYPEKFVPLSAACADFLMGIPARLRRHTLVDIAPKVFSYLSKPRSFANFH